MEKTFSLGGVRDIVNPEFRLGVREYLLLNSSATVASVEAAMPGSAGHDFETELEDLVGSGLAETRSTLGPATTYVVVRRAAADVQAPAVIAPVAL